MSEVLPTTGIEPQVKVKQLLVKPMVSESIERPSDGSSEKRMVIDAQVAIDQDNIEEIQSVRALLSENPDQVLPGISGKAQVEYDRKATHVPQETARKISSTRPNLLFHGTSVELQGLIQEHGLLANDFTLTPSL